MDVVEDVLCGVDLVADDGDLAFDWDLSTLLNSGGVREPVVPAGQPDVPDVADPEYNYLYSEGMTVLIYPGLGADEPFWLGEVEELGTGDRTGEYLIWFLETSGASGTYNKGRRGRAPATDWLYADSVQHEIFLTVGHKVRAKSKKEIDEFVKRWKRAAEESDDEVLDAAQPRDVPSVD